MAPRAAHGVSGSRVQQRSKKYENFRLAKPLINVVYLINFSGYGTHLHGDERGSWKDGNYRPRQPVLEQAMRELMVQPPFVLNAEHRPIVLQALVELAVRQQ